MDCEANLKLFREAGSLETCSDSTFLRSLKVSSGGRVSWFNHRRVPEPIGYMPPAESEANC